MKPHDFIGYLNAIINELNADIKEKRTKEAPFKLKNYKRFVELVKEMDEDMDLETEDDIMQLNIPPSLKTKFIEILKEGTINKKVVEPIDVKYSLTDIHGFGAITAKTYSDNGLSVQMLLDDWNNYVSKQNDILMLSKLNDNPIFAKKILYDNLKKYCKYLHQLRYDQLIGVKHFHNMLIKIPRAEMIKIEKVITNLIRLMNPKLIITVCGSYRRGKSESGDIDCLITHPDLHTNNNPVLLANIVKIFTDKNFIVDHLTDGGNTKYMGLCKIDKIPRRIDIRLISYNSYAFATLYFTGSANLNKQMREVAKKNGLKLNEYYLETASGEKKYASSEEEIFKMLNIPYLAPTERNI